MFCSPRAMSVALMIAAGLPIGCKVAPLAAKSRSELSGVPRNSLTDAAIISQNSGSVTARISAGSNASQSVAAPAGSRVAGAAAMFPPGSLAISTEVTVTEGQDIVGDTTLNEFGVTDSTKSASAASVSVASSSGQDATVPFTLSLPIPASSSLHLAADPKSFVVVYTITKQGSTGAFRGILLPDQFTVSGTKIIVSTKYFGVYEAVQVTKPVASVTVSETKISAPPLTATAAASLTPLTWGTPTVAVNGSKVTVSATLSVAVANCRALIDRDQLAPMDFVSAAQSSTSLTVDGVSVSGSATARLECQTVDGRLTQSGWSATFTPPALASGQGTATPTTSGTSKTTSSATATSTSTSTSTGTASATADTVAPTLTSASITINGTTSGSLSISWTPANDNVTPAGSLQYSVYTSNADNIGTVSQMLANGTRVRGPATQLSATTVTGLSEGQTLYVNILVADEAGNRTAYSRLVTTLPDLTAPSALSTPSLSPARLAAGLVTTAGWNQATDNVTPQSNLTYTVVATPTAGGTSTTVGTATGASTLVFTGSTMVPGLGYNVTVKAADAAGNSTTSQMSPCIPTLFGTGEAGCPRNPTTAVTTVATGINTPTQMTTDGTIFYLAESGARVVSTVTVAGARTVIAGNGTLACTDANGTSAAFKAPGGIVYVGGFLYLADSNCHNIRRIQVTSPYAVTTFAGSTSGISGTTDSVGTAARFNTPSALTSDGTYLYVADALNHKIRRINLSTAVVDTVMGTGTSGSTLSGSGTSSMLNAPYGVTAALENGATTLYIADTGNNRIIRFPAPGGAPTVLAGSLTAGTTDATGASAQFSGPCGLVSDGTNLYVADTGNSRIRKITIGSGVTGTVQTGTTTVNDVMFFNGSLYMVYETGSGGIYRMD